MRGLKFLAILIMVSLQAFPQQEDKLDNIIDEILFGKSIQDSLIESVIVNDLDISDIIDAIYKNRFIYVRSDYENRTYFSGQDLDIDQFNITGQVYYQGSNGLSLGVAGIMYSKFEPKYNTTILTAGYNNKVRSVKGLSLRASYSRYLFARIDSIEGNAFNSSVNMGLTYRYGILGTSADISLLMGDEFSGQLNFDLFADIPLVRLGLFSNIRLEPEISLFLGNETIVVGQFISYPRFTGEIYTEKNTFGLMNTTIRIPVAITIGNLDLRAGYNFNFPRIPGSSENPPITSFFNLSVGYIFEI